MTNQELITKFDPANSKNLSPADIEELHDLTDDQIDVLADAYPNKPTRKSYLRLYDKKLPADKQLFQMSTWQNLRNVRKFSNMKNLIAWDFISASVKFLPPQNSPRPPARKVVVDLTAQEAAAELTQQLSSRIIQPITQKPPVKVPAKTITSKEAIKENFAERMARGKAEKAATREDQDFTNGGTK